jgi:predicted nucleotidyltransferase
MTTIADRFAQNIDAIRRVLAAEGARLAYVFGSAATGRERPDSDLDVAVLLGPEVTRGRFGDVRLQLLTELVGLTHTNDVDLVILNEAPPLLAFEVIRTERPFLGTKEARVPFEVRVIQRLIDTQPLRDYLALDLKRRIQAGPGSPVPEGARQ